MEPGPSRTPPSESDNTGWVLSPNYQLGVYDPQAKIVPPYGYTTHRPPPIFVETQDKRSSYELVNPADDREGYTDPYERQDDNDTVPLVNIRRRSAGANKRQSTILPSTPLPRSPVPPGLAGGSGCQLIPGGTGFGTFFPNTTAVWANATTTGGKPTTMAIGQTIRWPRWGERTVCRTMAEIPNSGLVIDAKRNTPQNLTYVYVTTAAIQGLLEYAEISNRSLAQLPAINYTQSMDLGDELPPGLSQSDVAMMGTWWDNGVAHQFRSETLDRGDAGLGWTVLEIILVRLNESYAPLAQFPQYVPGLGNAVNRTRIGLDAALCVSEIRPYMLDAYNNTAGLPTTLGYVYSGSKFNTTGKKMEGEWIKGVQRGINSAGKWVPFLNAHFNSRNVMIKDNGRDTPYVPNPTVVSFTGNTEPGNYTKLVAAELQDVLGDVDCQHLLEVNQLLHICTLTNCIGDGLRGGDIRTSLTSRITTKRLRILYNLDLSKDFYFILLLAPPPGSSSISFRPLGWAASAQLELPPPTTTTYHHQQSMAQIEAKSWGAGVTVPEGRCLVNLDDSALRMLEPAQHRKNPVQSSYHSFKYHFKPESIDVRKPGKVQVPNPPRAAGEGGVALDVELLGPNSEDKHLFTAVEQATKDLDVFMIFDPTTGAFTMYEADSNVILSYDRAASKAASRSRSKTSPATQPLSIPAPPKAAPTPAPAPAPAAPVRLPVASAEPPAATDSAKRSAVAPKAKRPKPRPVPPPKPEAPPPPPVQEEAEEGELELEPVSVPIPTQPDLMEVDAVTPTAEAEAGEVDEPEGILPWDAVPTTSHKRAAAKTSAFTATDPDEEVIDFGPLLGGARDPPAKKGQNKSSSAARSGAGRIVLPKAAPRQHQEPPPRPAPVPSNPDPDDDEFEEIVPGVQDELESEMMKVLHESTDSSSSGDEDEEEGGFDEQAFAQVLTQAVLEDEGDTDSDDDDDSSSEEEDD
ncbi:hypothetical protein FRC11_008756 [Ceratobasidium sp. 423]|nr:hypothetical protein FRC11_008756 [Ceratobasidium sp. 423]